MGNTHHTWLCCLRIDRLLPQQSQFLQATTTTARASEGVATDPSVRLRPTDRPISFRIERRATPATREVGDLDVLLR